MDIKTTTTEINKIKRKLDSKRLLSLQVKDLCAYTLYRIKSLIRRGVAVSCGEIEHNLCEVGPGNRRLDPWTLNIILQSNIFDKTSALVRRVYNGIIFYSNKNTSMSLFDATAKAKSDKIIELQDLSRSSELLDSLIELIKITAHRNECVVIDSVKDSKCSIVDCEIHKKEIPNNNLLIRFCNSSEWVYPDSNILWTLFESALEKKHIPVLIAPYIHGSCFQLFKSLGMFARANYYLFVPEKENKSMGFIRNHDGTINEHLLNFSYKRCESVKAMLTYGEFDVLAQLLSSIIPAHYHSFSLNSEKMFKKLLLSENTAVKDFIANKKRIETDKTQSRIELFSRLLDSVSLGRIVEVKRMIKRCLKLIKVLESPA